ncbi:MAG: DNA translocase FtsK 4TM domain-containing protein [Pseudomonadales bacterium]|nr:DNA translocase FtsK 4TM domain-containing protein [Pseudomonadales bacterium]
MRSKTEEGVKPEWLEHLSRGLTEGAMLLLIGISAILLLALISYDPLDPGWSYVGDRKEAQNLIGPFGAWSADVLFQLFGYLALLFPVLVAYRSWIVFKEQLAHTRWNWPMFSIRTVGFLMTMAAGTGLASLFLHFSDSHLPATSGGILGWEVAKSLSASVSKLGASILLAILFATGLTLFTGLSWIKFLGVVGRGSIFLWTQFIVGSNQALGWIKIKYKERKKQERPYSTRGFSKVTPPISLPSLEIKNILPSKKARPEGAVASKKPSVKLKTSDRSEREKQVNLFDAQPGDLPPLGLLDQGDNSGSGGRGYSRDALKGMGELLIEKLKDFGVVAEVYDIIAGPVVTRFEIQPAPGVKASRISGLARDLARSLAVVSVRVVEVIAGKTFVGIEIPNQHRQMISLNEVLNSRVFDEAKSPVTIGLGKGISGEAVVADVTKMPHLLVAGTTGSGKSVGLNAMLISILLKASPNEVRLIMIDPKMLELSVYDDIPHLLCPVVTDMKEAANALRWCVAEMERRYQLMAAMGVRNIGGFNRKVEQAIEDGEPLKDPLFKASDVQVAGGDIIIPTLESLPFIVVVIDEFADMMMVVGKKVEELIARIAQKARAAGIHLILATQRPSVDVITGLIKANIPSRIAFQVSSKIDSRTILDQGGAEQLLGHGDMLYLPPGTSMPERVHGAFVSDEEVHRVCDDWRKRQKPNYLEEILDGSHSSMEGSSGGAGLDDYEQDALYDEVVAFVTETRKVSISSVQRRFKIGYNRSANIVEALQGAGVVSPPQSNGVREVLAPPPVSDH